MEYFIQSSSKLWARRRKAAPLATHMGTSLSPKSNLHSIRLNIFWNSFLKGEEEDQFLKDSAQDLKNRRNKNKVSLLPNPFLLPSYYIKPTLIPGSEVWSEASRRWAPWSWGEEGEEIDLNICQNLTLCLWFYTFDNLCFKLQALTLLDLIFSEKPNPTRTMQNEAGEYVDMYIPRWAQWTL